MAILWLVFAVFSFNNGGDTLYIQLGLGGLLVSIFHILICFPGYASGSPKWTKFIPALLGTFLTILPIILEANDLLAGGEVLGFLMCCVAIPIPILLTTFSYFSFMGDDKSDSCWLHFKTWTIKKPESKMII